ncbi:MAG: YhjD/YihY/BrkB family envelope integrity protein [Planctomycetota bacterium]|jgi:membrane protein
MLDKIKNLLTLPTNELGKWTRFLVFQVRIWFHCIRLLKINRCGTQAAALSYYTVFGAVPMTIVMLMIFQMFPTYRDMGEKVQEFSYDVLNLRSIPYTEEMKTEDDAGLPVAADVDKKDPNELSIADKIDEMSEQYMAKLNTGAIGVVSGLLLMYAAIKLFSTIENAFNTIFRIPAGRSFIKRMINYWSLITLGPLLLGLGIHFTAKFMMMEGLHQGVLPYVKPLFPFMISVLMFFFMYFVLPNARINPGAALWGATVGAFLWSVAKWGFGLYLTRVVSFNVVWGVLGVIPLTVLWIYWTWIFVLFGLQLAYATQNIKRLDAAEISRSRKSDKCFLANDQTVIRVMEYVLNAFERKDQHPVSVEAVAYRLDMPVVFTEKILETMVRSELLCRTNEPSVGYVPSTDGANISLDEISKAISEISFAQADTTGPTRMREVFQQLRGHLSKFTLKEVLNKAEDFQLQEELAKEPPVEEEGDSEQEQL